MWRFLVAVFVIFCAFLDAKVVLKNENIIVDKTCDFMEILGAEVAEKLGFYIYVVAVDSLDSSDFLDSLDSLDSSVGRQKLGDFVESFKALNDSEIKTPHSIIALAKKDKKLDIFSSHPREFIDEEKIFFEFISPLLRAQNDAPKNSEIPNEQLSAAVLNGFVGIADTLADKQGVALEHTIKTDKVALFSKNAMIFMLASLLILTALMIFSRKKK